MVHFDTKDKKRTHVKMVHVNTNDKRRRHVKMVNFNTNDKRTRNVKMVFFNFRNETQHYRVFYEFVFDRTSFMSCIVKEMR